MLYCNNCGVELETGMDTCPLCGKPALADRPAQEINEQPTAAGPEKDVSLPAREMTRQQRTLVWEIISIILLSASIAVLLVNFIINKRISWAEYPVAVCLVIFSYVSLFAFWSRKILVRLAGGLIASAFFLILLDAFTGGIAWTLKIAIPVLLAANLITAGLLWVIRVSRKGVNIIAYGFIGVAVLCIAIEGILSFYHDHALHLRWSMIVSLCALLVSLILLFVHFRLKKGRDLEKTFHI